MNIILKNKLILGVILAIINAFMLASMSLFAKMLSSYFNPVEVTFFRNIFSLVIIFTWILLSGNFGAFKTKRPVAHIFRGIIGTVGITLGAWALSIMPLAETTILLFTAPLFVTLLSYPILKESVDKHRLGAVFIGFIGVIIALNPSSNINTLPLFGIIIGLSWGFFSACVDVFLRWIGRTEKTTTTVFYFVLFGSITTSLGWFVTDATANSFSLNVFWIIAGLGLTGVLSLLAKTQSFRLAEPSIITPFMYSMIFWTMMFDYIFWEKIPSINLIIGTIIIIASNVFILYREAYNKNKSS